MGNGNCPIGAANQRDIANLARTCDQLRQVIDTLQQEMGQMGIRNAVNDTRTQLLLIGLPGVGSIVGAIVGALIMKALGV